MNLDTDVQPQWSSALRIVFRFTSLHLFLYSFPLLLQAQHIPATSWLSKGVWAFWYVTVQFVAQRLLHLDRGIIGGMAAWRQSGSAVPTGIILSRS